MISAMPAARPIKFINDTVTIFFDKAWNKFLKTQTKRSNLYLRYHTSNDVGKRPKWKSSKA